MSAIDRRSLLVALASSTAISIGGLASIPDKAQSAPLPISPVRPGETEDRIEKAVVAVRPRRRRVCWWRRGRRVCGWR